MYIQLSKDQQTLVDKEDYENLKQWKWYFLQTKKKASQGYTGYAGRIGYDKGRRYKIAMHRAIMNPPINKVIDHINGDGLDNRRSNLRICTKADNQHNRRNNRNNSSGYRGVYKRSDMKDSYRAQIHYLGKKIQLGTFKDPEEAFKVYQKAVEMYHKNV